MSRLSLHQLEEAFSALSKTIEERTKVIGGEPYPEIVAVLEAMGQAIQSAHSRLDKIEEALDGNGAGSLGGSGHF